MEIAAFDTHDFVKRLTGAGMPEAQAEILAEEQSRLMQRRLATKQDLEALDTAHSQSLKEPGLTLTHKIKQMEQRLAIRLGAILAVGITVLAILDKLL